MEVPAVTLFDVSESLDMTSPRFISSTDKDFCYALSKPTQTTSMLISSWGMSPDLFYFDPKCQASATTYNLQEGKMIGKAPFDHYLGQVNEYPFNPPVIIGKACETFAWSY